MTEAMPFLQKAILLSYAPRPFGGEIFSGRSRGVEVYPRQGKSPLEHQKISSPFGGGYFFWLLYCAIAIVRLRWHIIIIYNDIHARAEPAGILQKIRV